MFKMMKYEIIKNRAALYIIMAVMIITEVAFLITNYFKYDYVLYPIVIMLILGVFVFVWLIINGVMMFNRDFKDKSGYLVYMTPQPAVKIISAKILSTFFMGLVFIVMYYLLGVLDLKLFIDSGSRMYGHSEMYVVVEFLNSLLSFETFKSITRVLFSTLIQIFYVLAIGFLAVSLSNTVLRGGNKWCGIVSFIIFILVLLLASHLGAAILPSSSTEILITEKGLIIDGPKMISVEWIGGAIYSIAIGCVALVGTSYLVKNKIDL